MPDPVDEYSNGHSAHEVIARAERSFEGGLSRFLTRSCVPHTRSPPYGRNSQDAGIGHEHISASQVSHRAEKGGRNPSGFQIDTIKCCIGLPL